MQITEQIIERISRKVFNEMFSPALRQSNVVTAGSGSSVSWADKAGYANTAGEAATAASADNADNASWASNVSWSGVADKPAYATRWPSWTEVTSKPTSKTIWGQTYLDASSNFQNVSGALSSVTDLTMSGKLKIGSIYIEAQTDYIEVYKLDENDNKIAASLCAYGGVSALGVGTGGGGGGGTSLDAVWTAMGNATNEQINISHLATALTGYATQQWVGQQGYITASGSCNYATSAGSTQKVTPLDGITYGAAWLQYKDKHADEASNPANAIGNPTADWYHHIVMNHGNSGGYFVDMALCFHSNAFYYRRIVNGTANDWVRVLDSGNSSVSKSGSTLTVKINGTEQSLTDTNTWRPVVDNLTSTDTDKSLSANQGKVLKGYIDTLTGYFDASGNAKSALKLTTVSKTAWGQTFWTSGGVPTSISGDMSSVGDISFSASGKKIGGFLYFDTANNRLGVNQSSPSYALDVNGGAGFSGDVLPNADYATTAYNLGSSSYRWSRLYANFVELYGTAPSCHVGTSSSARISLHWSSDNNRGLYDSSGAWAIGTNGTNTFMMRGNVGIGTTSPSYKLHVNGDVYATGGVTCLSDIRKKDVIEREVKLSIDDIANAPLIYYSLKGESAHKVRLGSVAQYWANILPETVNKGADGVLSMQYDVQALTSVIALAREVKRLEEEVERLKKN